MTDCGDCGLWASATSEYGPLCLHCAYVRLTARRASERFVPATIPSQPTDPAPVIVTHFRKGFPKAVQPVADGKTWPELIAERL